MTGPRVSPYLSASYKTKEKFLTTEEVIRRSHKDTVDLIWEQNTAQVMKYKASQSESQPGGFLQLLKESAWQSPRFQSDPEMWPALPSYYWGAGFSSQLGAYPEPARSAWVLLFTSWAILSLSPWRTVFSWKVYFAEEVGMSSTGYVNSLKYLLSPLLPSPFLPTPVGPPGFHG